MDNFIVSARKYRPITFDSVVGQQHITGTLKNAIHNNQLAQAFLFCGPRGVGKTTCARILAKTINCENILAGTEPCGACASCKSFQNGNSFSIHELDAASNNSVDDIRNLIDQVRIPPQAGKYKIYIIDEVHMLSQAAFNAFLKTLEEPPSYAIFILATTEKHKILPTILSRCQIFDFNRIKVEDMASHLARIADREGIAYDQDGLHIIAQKADGGLRDALSMFDQIVSFSNKNVTYQAVIDNLNILDYDYYFKLTDAILTEDAAQTLLIFNEILNHGFDGSHFIAGLSAHFRNLLVAKEPATLKLLEVSDSIRQKYLQQSQKASPGFLLSALNISNQCEINYKTSKNQRLQVELSLLKTCHIASAIKLSQLGSVQIPSATEGVKKKLPEPVVGQAQQTSVVPTPQATSPANAPVVENPVTPRSQANPVNYQASETKEEVKKDPISNVPPKVKKGGWGASTAAIIPSLPDLNTIYDNNAVAKEGDEPELIRGSEQRDVSFGQFIAVWNSYAEQLKAENKINLYTMMTAMQPRLNGVLIEIDVENGVQMDVLQSAKVDVLNYLRVKLQNFSLDLQGVMMEHTISRKPYTSQEKYQAMVNKNPLLDTLRKEFNLGLS
ncbi:MULTISPECIES: DNA polymerase III subunit gamma/tau [Sphingobacterium]|uniref:DNA polymerase III subunit gamma/tau n=2 Tax=Sphingobacterium TaxID=28453 RepID=A0ACD5C712_9SPHI|nr:MULTISPECIES: DNA polymerase III subunit gamma/tau [Sphingobacterium]HBI88520.1 DNA polymerase III subunit gamma/tau [Sphingobacterium sp.]OFV12013.1 DNA polymerase III subunit gamma/tau [Sphingobacterium sp. HMSC13C05]QQT44798.1 DNA polymerase III subunit gamma/tau [Sphingobacterium multivorum]SUJ16923.1 DNA polymerase III subunit tau [Sphingobacterium multivorum]VXC97678.1 DNA polymerase III subunit gamma/tau [Sphingobacterium multivorum]